MPERDFDPDALDLPPEPEDDSDKGVLPGVDLQLGEDEEISGGDDLAEQDEENMFGSSADGPYTPGTSILFSRR